MKQQQRSLSTNIPLVEHHPTSTSINHSLSSNNNNKSLTNNNNNKLVTSSSSFIRTASKKRREFGKDKRNASSHIGPIHTPTDESPSITVQQVIDFYSSIIFLLSFVSV